MPPTRRGYLDAMLALATADAPAVVCLQEVPVWALARLEGWSGMRAHAAVARPARRPAFLAAWITRLHQGLLRSQLAGQANVILVEPRKASESIGSIQISKPGRERRIVQTVRVEGVGVIGNLHASNAIATPAIAAAELERARLYLDSVARPGEARILAGDLNLRHPILPGYENGGAGIDHILVSGLQAGPLRVWERERRLHNGRVLSDHAPVERLIDSAAEFGKAYERASAEQGRGRAVGEGGVTAAEGRHPMRSPAAIRAG